jgi:hypothetical protein
MKTSSLFSSSLQPYRDLLNAAGDDQPFVEMNFQFKPDINPAELQKAAAKGTAGETRRSEFLLVNLFQRERMIPNHRPGSIARRRKVVSRPIERQRYSDQGPEYDESAAQTSQPFLLDRQKARDHPVGFGPDLPH